MLVTNNKPHLMGIIYEIHTDHLELSNINLCLLQVSLHNSEKVIIRLFHTYLEVAKWMRFEPNKPLSFINKILYLNL
jgi:hypothetical protein